MAVKLHSKSPRPTACLRLAYSAPAPDVTVIEDFRRYTLPATKSLAFVKLRAHDQPMWRPASYWHVTSTGKREMDLHLGRRYARAAVFRRPQSSADGRAVPAIDRSSRSVRPHRLYRDAECRARGTGEGRLAAGSPDRRCAGYARLRPRAVWKSGILTSPRSVRLKADLTRSG